MPLHECAFPPASSQTPNAAKHIILYLQVKDIHLTADAFSVENNLLTPTFKLKRIESRQKYKDAIEDMYAKLEK